MAVYSAGSAKIDISANMDGLANEIRRNLERMRVEYDIDIGADLNRLRAQMAALRDESVDVRINLTGASAPQIEATAQSLRDLSRQMTRIKSIGDVSVVTRAVFSSNLSTAELETTARALRQMAAAVTRLQAAGDVRTVIDIDVRGIQNILLLQQLLAGLDRRININVNTSGLERVNGGAQSATRSLTTMQKVKFTALAAGIASLVPALVGVAGAAGGAAAALGAMGAVGIVGGVGIGDAFSALSEQTANAGAAAEDLVDKQSAVADALLSVENAQQGVADAQRSAVDAQRDLNDSYEEASRYLRDMNDELVSAEIAQERAEIALAKARGRRIEVNSDPRSTTVERAEADVDVRDALQRLREAKSKTADQRTDTTRANNAGVGGSDIVQQAKTRSDQANRAVVDAQNQLTQATRQLAEAQRDATSSAAGGVDKFAQAMAKLAPAAQDFVLQMRALGPAWTELRKATQQAMFDGLGTSVTQFANQNMAGFRTGMVQIAGYINTTFKDTLTSLSDVFARLSESGVMQQFITSIGSMMSGLAPMIAGITEGFIQMGAAAGPGMGILFESIGQLVATTGPFLGQLGNILAQSLASIMPTLGEFINAIAVGLGPVLPVLADLISGLGQALLPVLPPLSQLLVTLGQALTPLLAPLGEALAQLGPPLSAIVAAAGDLLLAISPILPVLGQLLAQIITPLASALGAAFQAMQPFVAQWAEQLAPLMQVLGPALAQIGVVLSQALVEAVQTLMPHMLNLVNSVVRLMVTLTPLLPQLAEMAVSLLPFLMQSLEILLPPFIVFIDLLNRAAQWALPMMMGALNLLTGAIQGVASVGQWFVDLWSDIWTTVSNTLSGKKDEVIGKFGELVRFVQDLPGRIRNAAAGMWDSLKDSFKGVLNWIISAWNDFSFTIKSPSWMGGKSVSLDTPDLPLLKAAGGAISGPGGPRDDLIPAMLSNGEYVIQASAVNRYGRGMLDAINARKFANGGLVNVDAAKQYAQSMAGTPYAMGGFGPGGIDCSGLVSAVVNVLGGKDPYDSRMSTVTEGEWLDARGFRNGKGNPATDVVIGWYDQGGGANGHTAGFLPGRIAFESAGPTGAPAMYGSGEGADQSIFDQFRYIPVGPYSNAFDKNPNGTPGSDQMGAWSPDAQNQLEGRSDAPKYAPEVGSTTSTTPEKSYPTSFSGWAGFAAEQFVGGQLKSLLGVLNVNDSPGSLQAGSELAQQMDKSRRKEQQQAAPTGTTPQVAPTTTPQSGSPAAPTKPMNDAKPVPQPVVTNTPEGGIAAGTPGAKEAVYQVWSQLGWVGNQWLDTLRLGNGESGWRVDAENPSSGAYGLGQFLGEDKKQRWPQYFTPDAAAQAGPWSEYIKERYGSPSEAWAFWNAQSPHWYHTGGQVAGAGDVPAWLEGGEYVVNRHAARANMPLLETINARRPMPSVGRRTNKAANGRVVNNNWTVQASPMDAIEAGMREQDRRAAAQMAGF